MDEHMYQRVGTNVIGAHNEIYYSHAVAAENWIHALHRDLGKVEEPDKQL